MTWLPRSEVLTFEEMTRIAALMVERYGVDSIRLTGGEPTVRANLSTLVWLRDPKHAAVQAFTATSKVVIRERPRAGSGNSSR